jgi:molybdopterin-biosynthesis enzyme MoeA-like protein
MSAEPGTPAEIVAVGRELLTGHTADTNSAWIAARLAPLGARVVRIAVVDDDPVAIAREVRDARARETVLIVTTGGLGPTFDDRTLAGVAAGLDRPLVEHPTALAFVGRRYAELAATGAVADGTVTPPRRKMAALPAGAEPIENPVGTAPGVLVRGEGFALLAVPGVPAEMRALVEAVAPALRQLLGGARHLAEREVPSGSGDESVVTLAAERVMAAVPGVHVKSLPTAFAPGCNLRVRLTASAADAAEAEARVARAADRLARELSRLVPS